MSATNLIDTLTEWARVNICDHIKLKQPPTDLEAPTADGYDYKLVCPAAFAMYVPTSEKLPPNVHAPFPSLCVRITAGQDEPASGSGFADVQFCFSTWDPGLHGKDVFKLGGSEIFAHWSREKADAYFKRNGDGWRDAWNFLDIGLRAVESVTHIGPFVIDRGTPIKYGALDEQISIPELYPTWFAWLSFRVTYPLRRNIEEFQNFL